MIAAALPAPLPGETFFQYTVRIAPEIDSRPDAIVAAGDRYCAALDPYALLMERLRRR
ncbi:MAG: hypothetical protein SGJ23_15930 [Alphaproteobacteria bacterium]|nr:hypothetical protein [Alphaproteobacteria bacterium]